MPEFLLVLSDPKSRKSVKFNVQDPKSQLFLGLKIGDTIDASSIGLPVKLKITGGTDRSGIPMRRDILGSGKRAVILSDPPGIRARSRGYRKRKLVRGNTISADIYQINAAIVEGNLPEAPAQQSSEAKPKK